MPNEVDPNGLSCCIKKIVAKKEGLGGNEIARPRTYKGILFPASNLGVSAAVWDAMPEDSAEVAKMQDASYGAIVSEHTLAFFYGVEIFFGTDAGETHDDCRAYQASKMRIDVIREKVISPIANSNITVNFAHDGKGGRLYDYGYNVNPSKAKMGWMSAKSFNFEDAPGFHLGKGVFKGRKFKFRNKSKGTGFKEFTLDKSVLLFKVSFTATIRAWGTDGVAKSKDLEVHVFLQWDGETWGDKTVETSGFDG